MVEYPSRDLRSYTDPFVGSVGALDIPGVERGYELLLSDSAFNPGPWARVGGLLRHEASGADLITMKSSNALTGEAAVFEALGPINQHFPYVDTSF